MRFQLDKPDAPAADAAAPAADPMQLALLPGLDDEDHGAATAATTNANDAAAAGAPLMLPMEAIEEDPQQPRKEFDAEALQQLADTIAERGVRQPLSVRPHPDQAGRWLLNFGARRLRASKLAGRVAIPVFVDATAGSYNQVIENEQREGLKPLELALFVQRRLAEGDNQAEIARCIGKSRPYVTYATALINAPEWLLQIYRDGRCRGLRELYDLRKLQGQHPQAVASWAGEARQVTREGVETLRQDLTSTSAVGTPSHGALQTPAPAPAARPAETGNVDAADNKAPPWAAGATVAVPEMAPPSSFAATTGQSAPRLQADLDGVQVVVIVNRVPAQAGHVYVLGEAGGEQSAVAASRLRLLGFVGR